uniref:Uncharacterized protein n=1 Tax=Micrurus lemniscatus lemniscatus TaxID=129467 RepID=A0A2D4I9R1_MICLE
MALEQPIRSWAGLLLNIVYNKPAVTPKNSAPPFLILGLSAHISWVCWHGICLPVLSRNQPFPKGLLKNGGWNVNYYISRIGSFNMIAPQKCRSLDSTDVSRTTKDSTKKIMVLKQREHG